MKRYSILLAITALIVASLACQTIAGGAPETLDAPQDGSGDIPAIPNIDIGEASVGGETSFPITSDAFNVISTSVSNFETVTYQTNMSGDEVIQFYKDEFGKLGYTEDPTMEANMNGLFTLAFEGHESGKLVIVTGLPLGETGSYSVTVALQ